MIIYRVAKIVNICGQWLESAQQEIVLAYRCSATGSETHESKGKARGTVVRSLVNDILECNGHPKQKHTDKGVES